MFIVIKLLFVALAVAGQAKLFPDREKPLHSELDTLALPHDHPEWALARRALAANGLCHAPDTASAADSAPSVRPAVAAPQPSVGEAGAGSLFAEACD